MMNKNLHVFLFFDGIFLVFLSLLALFHISFYTNAQFINTTYPDWVVHAFRIKTLGAFGLLSWTHIWSNGISLWKAYQFIPHFLTLLLINSLHVPITRGMVLMTIILFFLLRLMTYCALRLLKFTPFAALVCTILTFDIGQYWGGVNDFSLLFGFTFFPLYIFLWVHYFEGRIKYLFPYLAGAAFYIHQILGYSTFALWFLGIVFSERKIFSRTNIIQFFIFVASSSLWWYPLLIRSSYIYSNATFANKYFLGLVLASYKDYGLSVFLLVCFAASFFRIFMPIKKQFRWTRVLCVYVVVYFLAIIAGTSLDLPKTLDALQYTRGVTLIGIAIAFVFAPVVEDLQKVQSVLLKGGMIFLLCLVIIEGLWFTNEYSPSPSRVFTDPVSAFMSTHPGINLSDGRIWSSEIGLSSYEAPTNDKFPYSYMGHLESNQISPRISPLIIYFPYRDDVPIANINRLNTYFKISGVKYLFFEENSPFTRTIEKSTVQTYKDLGQFHTRDTIYHAFQVPWTVKNAILINDVYKPQMTTFPFNLELSDAIDQVSLDDYVSKYTDILYKTDNFSVPISYPFQDAITIAIPDFRKSNMLYVNESYDPNWKAYFKGHEIPMEPTGPNFILLHLDAVSGAGTITMKHFWPFSFYISIFLILTIPLEILLIRTSHRLLFGKNKIQTL